MWKLLLSNGLTEDLFLAEVKRLAIWSGQWLLSKGVVPAEDQSKWLGAVYYLGQVGFKLIGVLAGG